MTELTTTRRSTPAKPSTGPAPTVEPTLITEEQLQFSTAVARFPAPAKHRHRASAMSAVRGFWQREREHARRRYPQRFAYLESALLSRELDRL